MTAIQWFAFVILPLGLAIVAIVVARLFDRSHPLPATVGSTNVGTADAMKRVAELTLDELRAAVSQSSSPDLEKLEQALRRMAERDTTNSNVRLPEPPVPRR